MLILIVITLLLFNIIRELNADDNLDLVHNCFKNGLQPQKKSKTKESFEMHFGDPAVEVWNVFSGHDIHRMYLVEECVRKHVKNSFVDMNQTSIDDHYRQHGGSNVTYLTGYFQALVPDLVKKTYEAANRGIQIAEFPHRIYDYGIRNIEFLNYKAKLRMKTMDEIEDEYKKKEIKKAGLVVTPYQQRKIEIEDRKKQYDPEADENVVTYMSSDKHTVYTVFIMLSSRNNFSGGEILVRKHLSHNSHEEEDINDNDEYGHEFIPDEEWENENDEFVDTDDEMKEELQKLEESVKNDPSANEPQYDPLLSKISRHTPDKGNILVVRSEYEHGTHVIRRGRRVVLSIEFWPYADAEIGQFRPHVDEAKPFVPLNDEEL